MRRLALVLGMALLAGCAAKRANPPLPDAERGREVFLQFCSGCHPRGERGVGPALDRDLSRGLVVFQVRRGHGIMPGFHEEQIDEVSLEDLIAYVGRFQQEGRIRRETKAAAIEVVETIGEISAAQDPREPERPSEATP